MREDGRGGGGGGGGGLSESNVPSIMGEWRGNLSESLSSITSHGLIMAAKGLIMEQSKAT